MIIKTRKKGNRKLMSLYLPERTYTEIKRIAEQEGTFVNEEVNYLLKMGIWYCYGRGQEQLQEFSNQNVRVENLDKKQHWLNQELVNNQTE